MRQRQVVGMPALTSETAQRLGRMRRAGGHGWITVASTEPAMPSIEVHGGHTRRPPTWVERIWNGTEWVDR